MTAKSEAAQKALEIDKAAALVVDDIFNSLDNDGSKTLDFPEFANWARTDGRAIDWLEEYIWPMGDWMDDIELTDAVLVPDLTSTFSKELSHSMLKVFRGMGTASRLDEEEFVVMMLQILKLRNAPQSRIFAGRLFRFMDKDQGGTVTWQEFLDGVFMLCRGSQLERLRVIFSIIDVKTRRSINNDEFKQFVGQFWLQPVERIGGPRKGKKAPEMINQDTGPKVRAEMQAIVDGLRRRIAELSKWKEEALLLQVNQDVLKELIDETQRELRELQAKYRLLARERSQLIQEGKAWKANREAMVVLVEEAVAKAKHHCDTEKENDKERRLLLKQNEIVVEEYAMREAVLCKQLNDAEAARKAEVGALRAELEEQMRRMKGEAEYKAHHLAGQHFVKMMRSLAKQWQQELFTRLVTRWRAFVDMERSLLSVANSADTEAWLRNGMPAGWERRNMRNDRRPKGGAPLGYTTSLALAMPTKERMNEDGIRDGWNILEETGPGHTRQPRQNPRPRTASVRMKVHRTHSDYIVGKVKDRRAPRKEGTGFVPTNPARSDVMKMKRPDSAAESRLKVICLRTLSDMDSASVTSTWRSRSAMQ